MKSYIYYLFLMLIVLASCEEKENMIETGYLCVNPSMDYSLVTKAVESDSLQISISKTIKRIWGMKRLLWLWGNIM